MANRDIEKSPDVQWSWDRDEKDLKEWKDAPITQGIESSVKSSDIEWPWNKEKKEFIDSETKYVEPRYLEPRYLEPLKVSNSANKVSGDRPWWEEGTCVTQRSALTTQSKLTM